MSMRPIVVNGQSFRWRFDEQLVVIPAARSSPQLVVAWGWEDWLEPDGGNGPEPRIVTPRFVAAAIQFALQNGWNPAATVNLQLYYEKGTFHPVQLPPHVPEYAGGYTVPAAGLIDYPPTAINGFHLHCVEWIDNLHFILPPERFLTEPAEYVAQARIRWLAAGWEGLGEIGLLWLPAFVFPPSAQPGPVGVLIWHVKQVDDGISWLLSPVPLPFKEFAQ
jgi:hypothetical protein